jgi:hypothetical protein
MLSPETVVAERHVLDSFALALFCGDHLKWKGD